MPYDLLLQPRDGFFIKDGKGWYTAGAGRAYGHRWPPPPTLRGALTGAVGRLKEASSPLSDRDWRDLDGEVRLGCTVAWRMPVGCLSVSAEHRLWPAPADALWQEGDPPPKATRLCPRECLVPTLGCESAEVCGEKLWWPVVTEPGKPRSGPRWWTEADFVSWLRGETVSWKCHKDWPDPETRVETHVAINHETLTAADGMLFAHDLTETVAYQNGQAFTYGIACRADLPRDDIVGQWLTLGGRSRLVATGPAPADWDAIPNGLAEALAGKKRLRLVVVTPASFKRGWLPKGFDVDPVSGKTYRGTVGDVPATLRAAFVGRPYHLSGWSMRPPGPKPTDRLVPPGSVYFLELDQPLTEAQAEGLWLTSLGERTNEGLGVVVPGMWPEDETRSEA